MQDGLGPCTFELSPDHGVVRRGQRRRPILRHRSRLLRVVGYEQYAMDASYVGQPWDRKRNG